MFRKLLAINLLALGSLGVLVSRTLGSQSDCGYIYQFTFCTGAYPPEGTPPGGPPCGGRLEGACDVNDGVNPSYYYTHWDYFNFVSEAPNPADQYVYEDGTDPCIDWSRCEWHGETCVQVGPLDNTRAPIWGDAYCDGDEEGT